MDHVVTIPKGLEIWSAQTVCDLGILLSIVSFLCHIGRPYFERIQSRLTLRVGADLWWLLYVLLRDGTLFAALLAGFLNLNMDLMADIKIGLPFVPLGTVAIAAALGVKIFSNSEDTATRGFKWSFLLVGAGALLNTLGYVLVMECPGDEYAAAKTAFWKTMDSWRSNSNPSMAAATFYITFTLLAVIAVGATLKALATFGNAARERRPHVSD